MIRTVLHFSDSTVFGGTERGILHLITGMDQSRWRSVLFHHPSAPEALVAGAQQAGAQTIVAPRVGRKYDVVPFAQLVTQVRRHRPAVFHAHLHWPLACKYGIAASALARTPVTVATAQIHVELEGSGLVDLQHRLMTKCIDRYVAVSDHVADELERRFHVDRAKVTVIPNAVDIGAMGRQASTAPTDWPARAGRPVVLVVARLDPEKGVAVAIDSAARVPEIDVVIAGAGSLRPALEAQAVSVGVADRVFFLGHRDDVPALLRCADVFVLPSLREGLPLSVLEAMAAGVPVVATDIGGTREAVAHEVSGLLVPAGDAVALAAAIQRTLRDQPGTAARVAAADERVRRDFSTKVVVRRVTALYESLLSHRSS